MVDFKWNFDYITILYENKNKQNKKNNMEQDNIKTRVHAIIIGKLNVDEKELTPEANFSNDLGADSLDIAELIMEFEKEFNIAITDSDAEKLNTVGEAIDYIEQNAK